MAGFAALGAWSSGCRRCGGDGCGSQAGGCAGGWAGEVSAAPGDPLHRSPKPTAGLRWQRSTPIYGEKIRPLERSYKGKTIPASSPDRVETWCENGKQFCAQIWDDLVLPGVIPGPQAKTFQVYAIAHPAYATPWLPATPLHLKAMTVKAIHQDRWPVEQIQLSAK